MKVVDNITYDRFSVSNYGFAIVGQKGVIKIEYHEPVGNGDCHYCDIYFEGGTISRVFNLNEVVFKEEK